MQLPIFIILEYLESQEFQLSIHALNIKIGNGITPQSSNRINISNIQHQSDKMKMRLQAILSMTIHSIV